MHARGASLLCPEQLEPRSQAGKQAGTSCHRELGRGRTNDVLALRVFCAALRVSWRRSLAGSCVARSWSTHPVLPVASRALMQASHSHAERATECQSCSHPACAIPATFNLQGLL